MEATATLTTIGEYSQYFSELVELERKEEISRHMREIKSMSGEKREKAGRAILRMNGRDAGRGLAGSYLVKYGREGGLPDHDLSVGDLVIVSTGKPSGKEPQGTILEKTNFSLTVAFTKLPPKFAYAKKLRIDLFANDIPYQRMLDALKQVKKHEELADFILCHRQLTYQGPTVEQFYNTSLDQSQQETVQNALKADDGLLVHGPPGTGKTTTLIETIQQHVMHDHAVLATADSNTAVDNMVEKLVAREVSVVRVGNPARMNKELLNHALDYLLQFEEDFKEAKTIWEKIDEEKEQQQHHTKPTGQGRRGLSDREIKQLAIKGGSKRGIEPKKIKAMAHWP
jgi:predicted DNA helicase